MAGEQEARSSRVPEVANPDEETERTRDARWGWVEPAIWTERMIAALETGVKGGRWFSLMDNHQTWPNAYFDARGLFTMTAARKAAGYSRCGNNRLESRMREIRTSGSV